MSDLVPRRRNAQVEGCRFQSAVSENLIQTVAADNNFQNYFQLMDKRFNFNGSYGSVSLPVIAADGLDVFEFDSQIIDIWMFVRIAGSSGTTEIDIQVENTPGSGWNSIFTTTPKINFAAGDYIWVGSVDPALVGSEYNPSPSYVPPANTTQGVLDLSITNLRPAWSGIRCNLVTAQGGAPDGCGLLMRYRPI